MVNLLKAFVGAAFLLWLLQFKVGNETLELKAERWIQTSAVTNHLRDIAEGAMDVTHWGVQEFRSWVAGHNKSKRPHQPAKAPERKKKQDSLSEY